eukprot:TRINITY_DN6760_c0_g1_i2.p1 TRINITY_DN6760_c0_g1~~TRINITY_DN6760_c0_g1_i2.p1  ORF type:complete len:203 (-),score=61.77 TRINITY_DN6760_c0_g1_i2:35-577(-)
MCIRDRDNIYRGGGQLIPTARRACYSSFLMAEPKLMEPMFISEIQCTVDAVNAIHMVVTKRRGHVIHETAKPGTPLSTLTALIPAIDYFGFEVDLRLHTSAQAFCQSTFDHWNPVSGDPLDKTITLKILEPNYVIHLVRECLIKTRKRKGLTEDISLVKYVDDPTIIDQLKNNETYQNLI